MLKLTKRPAGRRHHRDKPRNELLRLKHQRLRAILPGALEPELKQSVSAACEAVLGKRWAGDMAAQLLQTSVVAAVDHLFGVHVDAPHLGDRFLGVGRHAARA